MGRLKPGVTLQQADARLNASAADFRAKYPTVLGPQNSFGVGPIRDAIVGSEARQSLLVYGGAVSFVLLIARERGEPPARPRHRPPTRDRDSRRHRRLARPHHPPAPHREAASRAHAGEAPRSALSARPRTAPSSATADAETVQIARTFADCAGRIEEIACSD
jgi:hypothetical protein